VFVLIRFIVLATCKRHVMRWSSNPCVIGLITSDVYLRIDEVLW